MAEHEPITTVLLPSDVPLIHILPKLPAKSISRFTSISKQWHSIIRTPRFRKMYLHHAINNDHQNHQKLLLFPNNRPWEFRTMDCEIPENGLTPCRPFPLKVRCQEMSIVASLHGMVTVALTKLDNCFEYSDLILWNPVTSDCKTLSKAGSHNDCYKIYGGHFGMYYSSSEDDYKLVCITRNPNLYIYSLKSDSWRKVKTTGWNHNSVSYHLVPSVLLNEKLYFLREFSDPSTYSVITLDTQTEKLRDIATPNFGNQRTHIIGFMVVRDCIHLCVAMENSIVGCDKMELWRMDGDGDWTKSETSSLKEHLSCSDEPQHYMRNGNWLMYSRLEERVYVLDTKKHTKDISCSISIAFSPVGKYMETFVSPNQYLK